MTVSFAETTTASKRSEPAQRLSSRARIARLILVYHFLLLIITGIYYLLRGFDRDEFTTLMGMLAPITALYGGAVFRYIGKSISEPSDALASNEPEVSGLVKLLVHGHFVTVLGLISLKALGNAINFSDMTMFLTLVETGVGVYMGNILLALFEEKK